MKGIILPRQPSGHLVLRHVTDRTSPVFVYSRVMMLAGSGRVRSIGGFIFSPI